MFTVGRFPSALGELDESTMAGGQSSLTHLRKLTEQMEETNGIPWG